MLIPPRSARLRAPRVPILRARLTRPLPTVRAAHAASSPARATVPTAKRSWNRNAPSTSPDLGTSTNPPVAILWDLENCRIPSDYDAARAIQALLSAVRVATLPYNAQSGGQLVQFQVYANWNLFPQRVASQLAKAGATLVHTPHVAGLSNSADFALITDALSSANSLGGSKPVRIFCLLGDRDYGPMLRMLRHWRHEVVLINPHPTATVLAPSLTESADAVLNWRHDILDTRFKYNPRWHQVAVEPLKLRQRQLVPRLRRSPAHAFAPLVETLLAFQHRGKVDPSKKDFHKELLRTFPDAFDRVGTESLQEYIALAVNAEVVFSASLDGDFVRLDRHYFASLLKLHLAAFSIPAAAAADLVEKALQRQYRLQGSFLSGQRVGGPVIPLRREQRFALRRLTHSPLATYTPLIETILYIVRYSRRSFNVKALGNLLTTEFGVDVYGQLGMRDWSTYLQSAMDAGLVSLSSKEGNENVKLRPSWFSTLVHLEAFNSPEARSDVLPTAKGSRPSTPSTYKVPSKSQPAKKAFATSIRRPGLDLLYGPSITKAEIERAPPLGQLAPFVRTLMDLESLSRETTHQISSGLLIKGQEWGSPATLLNREMARSAQSLGLVTMQSDDLTTLQVNDRFYLSYYHLQVHQSATPLVLAARLQQKWREQMGLQNVHDWYDSHARIALLIPSPLYAFVPLLDVLLKQSAGSGELMSLALKGAVLSSHPEALSDAHVTSWEQYVSAAKAAGIVSVDQTSLLPAVSLTPGWMTALFHLQLVSSHGVLSPPRPRRPQILAPVPAQAPASQPSQQATVCEPRRARTPASVGSVGRRPVARTAKPTVASSKSLRRRFAPQISKEQLQAALLSDSPIEAFGPLANVLLQLVFQRRLNILSWQVRDVILKQYPDTLALAGVDTWDSYLSLAQAAGIVNLSTAKEKGQQQVSLERDFYARLAEYQLASPNGGVSNELEALLDSQRMKQWDDLTKDEFDTLDLNQSESAQHPGVTDVIWDDQKDAFAPAAQARREPSPTMIRAMRRQAGTDIDAQAFAPLIENMLMYGGTMSSRAEEGSLFVARYPGAFNMVNTLGWKAYLKRAIEVGVVEDVPEEDIVELRPDFWVTLIDVHFVSKGKIQSQSASDLQGLDLSPIQARLHHLVQENGSAARLFDPMIAVLFRFRDQGEAAPSRLHMRTALSIDFDDVYVTLGVRDFDEYVPLAEAAGLSLSDSVGTNRFALDARWYARLLQLQRAAYPTVQQAMENLFSNTTSHLPNYDGSDAQQPELNDESSDAPLPEQHPERAEASLVEQGNVEFQRTAAALAPALSGIATNSLHTFMPLMDMMLTHATQHGVRFAVSKDWIRRALDANFESLYTRIGIRTFEDYVRLAKSAGILINNSVEDTMLVCSPNWWKSLALLHLSCFERPKAMDSARPFDSGAAPDSLLLGTGFAPETNQGEDDQSLTLENRDYLRTLAPRRGTVARLFAPRYLQMRDSEDSHPNPRLDELAEKLGLFQITDSGPWDSLLRLANLELTLYPHNPTAAEIKMARALPAPPADLIKHILACRHASTASMLDEVATIAPDRLATAFPDLALSQLVSQLQEAGLVIAAKKEVAQSKFRAWFSSSQTPVYSQIRLAPDWWQQFLRLHAAYQSK